MGLFKKYYINVYIHMYTKYDYSSIILCVQYDRVCNVQSRISSVCISKKNYYF